MSVCSDLVDRDPKCQFPIWHFNKCCTTRPWWDPDRQRLWIDWLYSIPLCGPG